MIAALFVDSRGPYANLPEVDPWDATRDALLYAGPHPVVAHPPCERWGRYATGGPSAKVRRVVGDDGGCFKAALAAVRRWGGALEHPADSKAWAAFGLAKPPPAGGWVKADDFGGFTCRVDQGQYGHRARKATWLYVFGVLELPELRWARVVGRPRLDAGFHSAEERAAARARGAVRVEDRLTPRECKLTPAEFRDEVLLPLARMVRL